MQLPYRKPGKYTNLPHDPVMTQAKYDELERELELLKKKRPAAAAEVARLAELGDFSENVEYQLAKRRLRGINSAMLVIERRLVDAEIIAPSSTDTVNIGSTVTVLVQDEHKVFTILGSSETDPAKGIISHTSPVGQALLGKKAGDIVHIGKKDYTVISMQ